MNDQAAAGWYHAQGDPPGTLRYWDGAQWVGEPQYPPQPAQAAAPFRPAPSGPESWPGSPWIGNQAPARDKGGIGARLLAYLTNITLTVAPFIVFGVIGGDGSVLATLGTAVLFGVFLWNSVYRVGTTGQSVGKQVMDLALLGTHDHQPVGVGKALGRVLLGWVLNVIVPIDLIWAVFDRRNQRLADKILGINVFTSRPLL